MRGETRSARSGRGVVMWIPAIFPASRDRLADDWVKRLSVGSAATSTTGAGRRRRWAPRAWSTRFQKASVDSLLFLSLPAFMGNFGESARRTDPSWHTQRERKDVGSGKSGEER